MSELETVELGTPDRNYSRNTTSSEELTTSSSEIKRPGTLKIIYSITIICLSTFFFGFCLTSSDFFIENFNGRSVAKYNTSFTTSSTKKIYKNKNETTLNSSSILTSTEISWFLSINLLGALCGNIVISSFHIDRKLVILLNNGVYLAAVLMMYFSPHVACLLVGKFILGIASGISCAYVPAYLTELKIYEWSGLIGSFQSVLVTLGVLLGYVLEMFFSFNRYFGLIAVCSFLVLHIVTLIFVWKTNTEKSGENIKTLLSNRKSWKSVIMSSLFHFSQQASGANVVLICASILLKNTYSSENRSVYVGVAQFLANIVAMTFVDKFGRKPLMIVSVLGVCVALSFISFSPFVEIGMYLFMISFSFGLGPITWFITGEIVPLGYRDPTNQIATSINWFSSFIAVVTQEYLFQQIGAYMFAIYLSFMIVYLIYLIVFFKETRGREPSFL